MLSLMTHVGYKNSDHCYQGLSVFQQCRHLYIPHELSIKSFYSLKIVDLYFFVTGKLKIYSSNILNYLRVLHIADALHR